MWSRKRLTRASELDLPALLIPAIPSPASSRSSEIQTRDYSFLFLFESVFSFNNGFSCPSHSFTSPLFFLRELLVLVSSLHQLRLFPNSDVHQVRCGSVFCIHRRFSVLTRKSRLGRATVHSIVQRSPNRPTYYLHQSSNFRFRFGK